MHSLLLPLTFMVRYVYASWLGMDTGPIQASIGALELWLLLAGLCIGRFDPTNDVASSEADATGRGSAFGLSQCVAVITLFQQLHAASLLPPLDQLRGECQHVHVG